MEPSTPKKIRLRRNELAKEERPAQRERSTKIFQRKWMEEDSYKHWLRPIQDDKTKCRCIACNAVFLAGKSELEKHASGKKHQSNLKSLQGTSSVAKIFDVSSSAHATTVAEMKLSAFFAKSNAALSLTDSLTPLLKNVFPDSKTCQEMTLSRRKCTAIISNVLSPVAVNEIVNEVGDGCFAILVDESTDTTDTKFLALLINYFDSKSETPSLKTELLELIPLHLTSFTAENLYKEFKECLARHNLKVTNVVGMASDNASVMVGEHNSFYSRLRADNPHVILMRCLCHSSAIIAGNACAQLPRSPEDLVRNVATYVSGSSKRCEALRQVQDTFEMERKKMLKLSDTRWLALYESINRMLEYYEPLIEYFTQAAQTDKLKMAENILAELKNSYNRAYLLFLKYVLKMFNTFSLLFQSKQILIHKLSEESRVIFKELCSNFIKHEYLRKIETISITEPNHLRNTKDVNVGAECEAFIKTLPENIQIEIKTKCLNFYVKAAEEMKSRLPLADKLFDEFRLLDPKYLFSRRVEQIKIPHLIEKFKNSERFNVHTAQDELLKMFSFFDIDEIAVLKEKDIASFWKEMKDKKNFANEKIFPNISELAELILSLPHSNAEAERIFSILNDVKTAKRNRLSDDNLNGIITFRSAKRHVNLTEFQITKDHLARFNKDMY